MKWKTTHKMVWKSIQTILLQGLCLALWCIPMNLVAQGDSSKPAAREFLIYLKYHVKNNSIPYLQVQTKTKEDKAFLPAADVKVELYLDKDSSEEARISQVQTDKAGDAIAFLPPSAAKAWAEKDEHTFYARTSASNGFGAAQQSLTITKARLVLDTATGAEGRTLIVQLQKKAGANWVPVAEADIKLAVKRLGGYLPIAGDETYATDSTGSVKGEFQLTDLPGDSTGKIECIAIVEDHDEVGTMETSLVLPWGKPAKYHSEFGKRTLWATGRLAPIWLLVMAFSCIIGVWLVIIILVRDLFRIKKLGSSTS